MSAKLLVILDANLVMVRHTCFLFFFLLVCAGFNSLQAGNENYSIGGRSAGLANASLTLTDLWSVHHNQAGLAYLEKISAGIFYENRYLLSELSVKGGVAAIPTKSGVFGVSISSFGYSAYSENKYGVAYARKLSDKFSVGIQLNYLSTQLSEPYGNKSVLAGEIGFRAQLTNELSAAAHIFNPTRAKLADYNDERTPTILRFGLGYAFSEKVTVVAEAEKDIDYAPAIKAGIEYYVIEQLYLRAGVGSKPFTSAFGFGLKLKQFQLDFASTFHQTLGYTPQVSLSYDIK